MFFPCINMAVSSCPGTSFYLMRRGTHRQRAVPDLAISWIRRFLHGLMLYSLAYRGFKAKKLSVICPRSRNPCICSRIQLIAFTLGNGVKSERISRQATLTYSWFCWHPWDQRSHLKIIALSGCVFNSSLLIYNHQNTWTNQMRKLTEYFNGIFRVKMPEEQFMKGTRWHWY